MPQARRTRSSSWAEPLLLLFACMCTRPLETPALKKKVPFSSVCVSFSIGAPPCKWGGLRQTVIVSPAADCDCEKIHLGDAVVVRRRWKLRKNQDSVPIDVDQSNATAEERGPRPVTVSEKAAMAAQLIVLGFAARKLT